MRIRLRCQPAPGAHLASARPCQPAHAHAGKYLREA